MVHLHYVVSIHITSVARNVILLVPVAAVLLLIQATLLTGMPETTLPVPAVKAKGFVTELSQISKHPTGLQCTDPMCKQLVAPFARNTSAKQNVRTPVTGCDQLSGPPTCPLGMSTLIQLPISHLHMSVNQGVWHDISIGGLCVWKLDRIHTTRCSHYKEGNTSA